MNTGNILERRQHLLGPSLSVAYREPLKIVRGEGAYLFDEEGSTYLDLVNNVCHVGHCHPRVVEAMHAQIKRLNTNTRYLHDTIIDCAERLLSTFPQPLGVCFFVCSGSEANELALRLARTHTGRRDVVVVDGAYHGNTGTLVEMSPYKFNGPGGAGPAEWVHVAPMPDDYRGTYRRELFDCGSHYANETATVIQAAAGAGCPPAAFFCESALGCGGHIILPPGYLSETFAHARDAGVVCVADEVQTGFGRAGSHFWMFETRDAVPDIVTLGKPMGNGHPVAAVITTPEIAASFDNGMEYFNTFGGNPVSCAAARAVLEIINDEGLQPHALELGECFLEGLEALKKRHTIIGDVRGQGLFIGVELVNDRDSLTPAADMANQVTENMKARGVLLSTDGPQRNVLKIKPPLVITRGDVERTLDALDEVLGNL